jgi:hypothetical protein
MGHDKLESKHAEIVKKSKMKVSYMDLEPAEQLSRQGRSPLFDSLAHHEQATH